MTTLVLRRLFGAVPLVWGVLTLVFLLFALMPGEPFTMEPAAGVSPDSAATLRRAFGADRPLAQRYLEWMGGLVRGDLGVSFSMRRPVADLILEAAGNTLRLLAVAILLQFVLGVGAGLACASAGGWLDRAVTAGASCLYSMPSYWLGLTLTWLLSVRLGWLPVSQMRSVDSGTMGAAARLSDSLRHMALPLISLCLPAAGGIALYVREVLREILNREFIRSARARGLSRSRALMVHGMGNALLPIANLFGLALPALIGGSVVIEVLFAWPGMGRLIYQSVLARDEPLILGCACAASLSVVVGSLIADLICAVVDPRVREAVSS